MKKLLLIMFMMAALFASACALAESGCSYFDINGDHDWIYGKTEAACDTAGEAYRDCSECGVHEVQETIAAKGHDWQEVELVKEADCENDGEKLVACAVCGQNKSLILPATGHVYGDWMITEEATCARSGERTTECVVCGEKITEIIERTEHNYGDWKIAEEATDHSMGKRYRQCDECGATNEDMYYPDGTLYRGMHKSDEVKQMQLDLMRLRYLMDKADGIFGKNTEAAVIAFQEDAGLEATGIAYPHTLEAIELAIAVLDNEENIATMAHCMHGELFNGQVILCEQHAMMTEESLAIYQAAENSVQALADIYEKWNQELDRLYDEWLDAANAYDKDVIESSHDCFYADLEAHMALIDATFDNEPEKSVYYGIEMIMDQCAYVCELMNVGK